MGKHKYRALYSPDTGKQFRWNPTEWNPTPGPFTRPTTNEPQTSYMRTKNQEKSIPTMQPPSANPGYYPKDAPSHDPSNQERSVRQLDRHENQDQSYIDQNLDSYPGREEKSRQELKKKIRDRLRELGHQ